MLHALLACCILPQQSCKAASLNCPLSAPRHPSLASNALHAGPVSSWSGALNTLPLLLPHAWLSVAQVQLEAEGTEMLAKQRVKLMSMTPEKKWKDKGQVGGAGAGRASRVVRRSNAWGARQCCEGVGRLVLPGLDSDCSSSVCAAVRWCSN